MIYICLKFINQQNKATNRKIKLGLVKPNTFFHVGDSFMSTPTEIVLPVRMPFLNFFFFFFFFLSNIFKNYLHLIGPCTKNSEETISKM